MPSPAPSIIGKPIRTCVSCGGPVRGHTRVNRKNVCPSREKVTEILEELWNEGHHDSVKSIADKLQIQLPSFQMPLTPQAPPAHSPTDQLQQRGPTPFYPPDDRRPTPFYPPEDRRPTPFYPRDDSDEIKPKTEGSVSMIASSLRKMGKMMTRAIDEGGERFRQRTPPLSPSYSSSDTTIPDTSSEGLPPVGAWDLRRRRDYSDPPEREELLHSERGSWVPTLRVGSDGQTIREGPLAEAHFRAQAALEERLKRRQQLEQEQQQRLEAYEPRSESYEGLSVIQLSPNINDQDFEGSGFHRVLRSVMASPAIMAIPVRPEDVPRVQETAARHGLHTSVLEVVPKTPRGTSRALPQVLRNALVKRSVSTDSLDSAEDNRPIVVIGRDPVMTQRYVEMAQRGVMPGTVAAALSRPQAVTMTQLIFIPIFTVIVSSGFFLLFSWWTRS